MIFMIGVVIFVLMIIASNLEKTMNEGKENEKKARKK